MIFFAKLLMRMFSGAKKNVTSGKSGTKKTKQSSYVKIESLAGAPIHTQVLQDVFDLNIENKTINTTVLSNRITYYTTFLVPYESITPQTFATLITFTVAYHMDNVSGAMSKFRNIEDYFQYLYNLYRKDDLRLFLVKDPDGIIVSVFIARKDSGFFPTFPVENREKA